MISDLDEETLDIDWFSLDADGHVAHFASGGTGFLPESVKMADDEQQMLSRFFRSILPRVGNGVEAADRAACVNFESEAQRSRYLAEFLQMASRGLYSFDSFDGPSGPTGYFVVSRPAFPICVKDLPMDVQKALRITRFLGRFCDSNAIQVGEFADPEDGIVDLGKTGKWPE